MGNIATALGQGSEYQYKDKIYRLSPCTYEIQGLFETYLERQALEAYHRIAPRLSSDDQEKMLAAIHRDITLRVYTFGGKAVRDALDHRPHLTYMIFLMLKKNHPELTLEHVKEMFTTDREALLEAVSRADADPNAENPVDPAKSPAIG